jgi:uncharacterized Zn finger protein
MASSCPSCHSSAPNLLADLSKDADVNYYRCSACGHVWTTTKGDGVIVRHVTTLPGRPTLAQ